MNRNISYSVLAGVTACAILTPAEAQAPAQRHYEIPAGPLETALNRFGREAGVLITFGSLTTDGLRSNGLSGDYTLQQAFLTLLAGTGRQAVRNDAGGYTVLALPSAVTSDEATTTLGTVKVIAERSTSTEGSPSYIASGSSVGGKTVQSIQEVPQTVSVMTSQAIADQNLHSVHDVLLKMPGVAQFQGTLANSRYLSRGFEIGNMRVDGGTAVTPPNGPDDDTAFYDHVEVLRGADGLFGASAEPGGTVNLIRKKPTIANQVLAQVQVGGDEFRRLDLDLSGALTQDGSIRGRTVMAQENKDFFYKNTYSKRSMIYGIIEADLGPETLLTLGGIYNQRNASYQGYGLPRYSDGADLRLPRDFQLSGADDHQESKVRSAFARLDHQLNQNWKVTLDLNYDNTRQLTFEHYFNGTVDPGTGAGVYSYGGPTRNEDVFRNASMDLNLSGRFDWLGRSHQAVLGHSWQNYRAPANQYTHDVTRAIDNIFAFNPLAFRMPVSMYHVSHLYQVRRQSGTYGSLKFQLTDPLHVVVGGRYSRFAYKYTTQTFDPSGVTTDTSVQSYKDNGIFSPYLAGIYTLGKDWSVYASVAETYKSQASYLSGPTPGKPLQPVTGRNYEVGVKGEHWGGKLTSALALYRIERKNQAVRDSRYAPVNGAQGSSCCYIADGNILSQGLDAEIGGEIAPRTQLTASYNFNSNRDKNAGDGRYQALTPKQMAKLFGSYQLQSLPRLKLGAGINVQGTTSVAGTAYSTDSSGAQNAIDYRFSQGGYAIWSAFADYQINDRWNAQLNVSNAFDKNYYATVGYVDYGNFYGAPRAVMLTIRGRL